MGFWTKALGVLIAAAIYTWNPFYLRSNLLSILQTLFQYAHLATTPNPNSLKAAISNVTGDFDQLSSILQDFFERLPDNSTEIMFRDFLETKAGRTHKDFERCLDWVLGFYRFAWPFLVVYALLRLSSGGGSSKDDFSGADAAPRSSGPDRHARVKKKTEDYPVAERRRSGLGAKGSDPDLLAVSLREEHSGLGTSFSRSGHGSQGPFGRSLSAQSFG